MAIHLHCPSGHPLTVEDHYAGKQVRCGQCGGVARVPATSGASASRPQPMAAPVAKQRPDAAFPPVGEGRAAALAAFDEIEGVRAPGEVGTVMQRIGRPRAGKADAGSPSGLGGGSDGVIPPGVYEADPAEVRRVNWLAAALLAATAFSVVPVVWRQHMDLETAPGWARAVLLLALGQAVFVAWMVTSPDWASVRIVTIVFGLVSAIYALVAAVALATPLDRPMFWGMTDVRYYALYWCAAVLVVMCLATYLSGRVSTRWYRNFRKEMSRRAKRRRPTA